MKKKNQSETLNIILDEKEINNLYHPAGKLGIERYRSIVVKELSATPFLPLALKEWFFLLAPEGTLEIQYTLSDSLAFTTLERTLWWLFHGNYNILEHTQKDDKGNIVLRKNRSIIASGDTISRWTFGIITNGDRNDWMEEIIQSIHEQKIPEYEIIVCGNYKERREKQYMYIPFNERSKKGWITKKKNLIGEHARYENLCILHDRLVLGRDWFQGMKQFGNAFDLLGCRQIDRQTGEQAGDWLTFGGPIASRYTVSRLDYKDWDRYAYLSGQLTIIKKHIWRDILWDETRYWDDLEDVDLSFRARDAGYLVRFNTYAQLEAFTWRHGKLPLKYDPKNGILPKDMLFRRTIRNSMRLLYMIPFIDPLVAVGYKRLVRTGLYKKLIYH